jgi:hypothetical protein
VAVDALSAVNDEVQAVSHVWSQGEYLIYSESVPNGLSYIGGCLSGLTLSLLLRRVWRVNDIYPDGLKTEDRSVKLTVIRESGLL